MQASKSFYSVDEFSKILSVHPHTIRAAIKAGRIHALRVGPSPKSPYRIPESELERVSEISFEDNIRNVNSLMEITQ